MSLSFPSSPCYVFKFCDYIPVLNFIPQAVLLFRSVSFRYPAWWAQGFIFVGKMLGITKMRKQIQVSSTRILCLLSWKHSVSAHKPMWWGENILPEGKWTANNRISYTFFKASDLPRSDVSGHGLLIIFHNDSFPKTPSYHFNGV